MDRVLEARLTAVATRVDQLSSEEQALLARLRDVRERLGAARAEHEHVQRSALRSERPRAGSSRTPAVDESLWRQAVRNLGTFTVGELATELGVSPITAKKHLTALATHNPPLVRTAGKLGRSPIYEYIAPTEAGAGFDAQQRLRVPEPIMLGTARSYSGPVPGTGSHPADVIASTAVRKVVKDAIAQGWQLVAKGDGHWNLVKDGKKVGVAGTPRNPTGAAAAIARHLRNAERVVAA